MGELLEHVLVPVASEDDARATAGAVRSWVDSDDTVTFVYVVEKAGGAVDKASVEQREEWAEGMFDVVREVLGDSDVTVETDILYGTEVAETIIDAAHDRDASAIAFTPRGGSRWVKLLTPDVAGTLIAESDLPVVVLPDEDGAPADDAQP